MFSLFGLKSNCSNKIHFIHTYEFKCLYGSSVSNNSIENLSTKNITDFTYLHMRMREYEYYYDDIVFKMDWWLPIVECI